MVVGSACALSKRDRGALSQGAAPFWFRVFSFSDRLALGRSRAQFQLQLERFSGFSSPGAVAFPQASEHSE